MKKHIRVSAIREAGKLLGNVIMEPSKKVFGILLGTLKKTKDIPAKMLDEMGKISKDIVNWVTAIFKRKSSEEES